MKTLYPTVVDKHYKQATHDVAKKLAFMTIKDAVSQSKKKAKTKLVMQEASASSCSEDSDIPEEDQEAAAVDQAEPEAQGPDMPLEKTGLYLNSFWRINFDWDENFVSDSLKLMKSDSQTIDCAIPLQSDTGKICKAINQQHFFKTAFGTHPLEPNGRYYFEIRCLKGTNFKIGIATEKARSATDQAFSDTADGYAYFSNGQLRHNSKGQGPLYGEPYKEEDVIGCYVDLIDVSLSFRKLIILLEHLVFLEEW